MPKYAEEKILPYPAQFLYDLVLDVEKYPEFLPWCLAARTLETHKDYYDAELIIGYRFYREKFISRVHKLSDLHLQVEYLEGPFQYLENHWKFNPIDEHSCEVDFDVSFEFQSKFFESLIASLFTEAVHRMIHAFETRAAETYQKENA